MASLRGPKMTEAEQISRVFEENKNDPRFAAQSLFHVVWRANEFGAIKFDNICILMRTLCRAAGLSDKEIDKFRDDAFISYQKHEKEKVKPSEKHETQPCSTATD